MKQFIYADNAATTKMSDVAVKAMLPYLQEIYANASSVHLLGQRSAAALFSARQQVAQVLNCAPKEVFFTSGGSEADNQALISAAAIGKKQGKCHIVSTAMEHHAILHTLEALEAQGFTVTLLRPQADGIVTATQVAEAITDTTCLVSVMYANNETGAIQPIREIGALCRKHGVLFHTDAVQAAGHLAIDVQRDNIDMLSLSAHKFHGPKGIGLLFAKSNIQLTSLIRGGGQERGKRAGTENLPGIIGLAAALKDAQENMQQNTAYITGLRDALRVGTGVTTVEVRTAAVFKRSRCTWRCRRSRGAGAATTAFWMPTRVTWTAAGAAARSAGTTKSATATRTAMRSTPAWRMCAPPPVEARRECLRVARRTLLTSVITLALIVCVMATIVSVLFVVRKDREKASLVENCGVYGVWTKQDTPYYYKPNTA